MAGPASARSPASPTSKSSGKPARSSGRLRKGKNIGTRPGHSANKRKREHEKLARRQEKAERKLQRKEAKLHPSEGGTEAEPSESQDPADETRPATDPAPDPLDS